jgi:hypothetical protein
MRISDPPEAQISDFSGVTTHKPKTPGILETTHPNPLTLLRCAVLFVTSEGHILYMAPQGRGSMPSSHGPSGGLYEPLSAARPGSASSMDERGDDLLLSQGRSQADRGCNRSFMGICGLLGVAMLGGVGAEMYHSKHAARHPPAPAPSFPPTPPTPLGPGAGPWRSAPAEAHGLSSTALAAAADAVAEAAPDRHCFLVVKDGAIVHERYYGDANAGAKYESDSLGKQGTSLIMTMAATRNLIDLDKPLASYNVTPMPNTWPPKWWPNVTARHLLSQTGGCVTGGNSGVKGYPQCYSAPGTNWTYDSEDFIGALTTPCHP